MFSFFTFLAALAIISFMTATLIGVRWFIILASASTSVMGHDVEPVPLHLLLIHISSSEKVLFHIMYPLFNWISCLWLSSSSNSLCHCLSVLCGVNRWWISTFWDRSLFVILFCCEEAFSLIQDYLSSVCFCAFVVIRQSFFLNYMLKCFPCSSSCRFFFSLTLYSI